MRARVGGVGVGGTRCAAIITCMAAHSTPATTGQEAPAPGRYVPANASALSRTMKRAGLRRRNGAGSSGYAVRGNDVSIVVSPYMAKAGVLEEMVSVAKTALAEAGYLVLPHPIWRSGPGHFEVHQLVRTDAHAQEFLRYPTTSKVVTQDGEVIAAADDLAVQAEIAALELAEREQADAADRARKLAEARLDAVIERLASFGVAGTPAPFSRTNVAIHIDDLERLLGLLEAGQ